MSALLIPSLAFASVAAAVAVAVASASRAAAVPDCTNTGPTTTQCERPGNAQINTSPGYSTYNPGGFPLGPAISINLGGLGY